MEPLTLSIAEFCVRIGCKRSKAFSIIREGEVDVIRLGKLTRVTVASVDRMLERHTVKGRY